MKFLFVHQNFPGQFLHLVRHLVRSGRHEIVFITEPNGNHIKGVRKLPYRRPAPVPEQTHWVAREFESAVRRAETVARTAVQLKALAFEPDIIIGHHGWGELLDLPDIWPDTPLVGYLEFFYRTQGQDVGFDPEFGADPADFPRIRAKNATNLMALNLGAYGQTPTRWQLSTYPEWAQPRIQLLPEGVNLETCAPDAAAFKETLTIGGMTIEPGDKLVTYVARDLEPYRGFHALMRALPAILSGRPDVKAVLVGGDGVSYGAVPHGTTWREIMMREVGRKLDMSRVAFPGKIDYALYTRMLQRSDAHVYLTYPFVASWSLREAIATGCVVVGSDTDPVREFITHGRNGMLVSLFEPARLAEQVLEVLGDAALSRKLRAGARRYAEKHLDVRDTIAAYEAMIARLTGKTVD